MGLTPYRPTQKASTFIGMNNIDDVVRVQNIKGGIWLTEAENVIIDNSGMMHLRPGQQKLYTGSVHSLWSNGTICLFMENGQLKFLHADYSTTVIKSGMDLGARVSFVSVGDKVFFTNGIEIGYVLGITAYPLVDPGLQFKATLPPGNLIEYWNNRLYVVRGSVVYYSDPVSLNYYDIRHNFIPFESTVTMFQGLLNGAGIFASDQVNTYFLAGSSPLEFTRQTLLEKPTLPNGYGKSNGLQVARMKITANGEVLIFATPDGFYAGTGQGQLIPLTPLDYQLYNTIFNTAVVHTSKNYDQFLLITQQETAEVTGVPLETTITGTATLP